MSSVWKHIMFLFLLASCSGSNTYVEETPLISKDLHCVIQSADSALLVLEQRRKTQISLLDRIEKQRIKNKRIESYYNDSINSLTELNLINRDTILYEYEVEIIEVVDTVEVHIADSVCPVCIKRKNRFKIFKKKK
jgi:rubrerythrin